MGIYGNAFSNINGKINILESGILEIENEYNNFSKITESFSILTESNIILEFSIKDIFKKIGEFFKFLGRKIKELWQKIFGKKKVNEEKLAKAEENIKKAEEKKSEAKSDSSEEKKEGTINKNGKFKYYKYIIHISVPGQDDELIEELKADEIDELINVGMSKTKDLTDEFNDANFKNAVEKYSKGDMSKEEFDKVIDNIYSALNNTETKTIIGSLKLIDFKNLIKIIKEENECFYDEFVTYYKKLLDSLKSANEKVFTIGDKLIKELGNMCEENANYCDKLISSGVGIEVTNKEGTEKHSIGTDVISSISKAYKMVGNMMKDCNTILVNLQKLVSEYIADIEHDSVIKFA